MLKIAGKTDVGLYRQANQDSLAVTKLAKDATIALICDGMGGESGGQIASEIARDVITRQVKTGFNSNMDNNSIRDLLHAAVSAANITIYDKAQSDPSLEGMGTTAVAAIISGFSAYIAHMGDSRAYIYDDNMLLQLTKDHSVVQVLVEKGEIDQTQARNHPQKNYITRAVGVDPNPEIDYLEVPFTVGQKLLLCTDGLTNYCTEDDIRRVLRIEDTELICDELIRLANAGGGGDNITVIVISR